MQGGPVGRLIKWFFILAFAAVLVGTGSYAAARFASGSILGPKTPIEGRAVRFAFEGVEKLPGSPRAWVFTYDRVRLPGVQSVEIIISPSGKVLSLRPRDLEQRLINYRKSLEP
jgi:hypothetical protein